MNIKVSISNHDGSCKAEAIYAGDKITVLKGGKISQDFAAHIKGGTFSKKMRENKEVVDSNGIILQDCEFSSPSTAAQFVTGRSTNGYSAWKVDKKVKLGDYLKSKGLR